jgi:hypothetical protein
VVRRDIKHTAAITGDADIKRMAAEMVRPLAGVFMSRP